MIKLGEKIKTLRRQRNISQEVLAGYLGVTFQAVSKWETDTALPDVELIPAIASFFGVSTDELFDYNRLETEKKVREICDEAYKYRHSDPGKSEAILKEGLKQFPGNDIILNNLLYAVYSHERAQEVIGICKTLIESTRDEEVKYDALRFLAHAYDELGEYALVKETVEKIPEIYFSKLSVAAELYRGEDAFEFAAKLETVSFENLLLACRVIAECYKARGETDKARSELEQAIKLIDAVKANCGTEYTLSLYETYSGCLAELHSKISDL